MLFTRNPDAFESCSLVTRNDCLLQDGRFLRGVDVIRYLPANGLKIFLQNANERVKARKQKSSGFFSRSVCKLCVSVM